MIPVLLNMYMYLDGGSRVMIPSNSPFPDWNNKYVYVNVIDIHVPKPYFSITTLRPKYYFNITDSDWLMYIISTWIKLIGYPLNLAECLSEMDIVLSKQNYVTFDTTQ